jgi:predicted DNA-binding protein YlxM (UPF0122 family)
MKQTKKSTTHYTITEAAKKLGISRAAVFDAIKSKRLRAKKGKFTVAREVIGWHIATKDLDQYRVSDLHQEAGKKND